MSKSKPAPAKADSSVKVSAKLMAQGVDKVIDIAIAACKAHLQSAEQTEQRLADAGQICLQHALDHGDCTKMDRLVKSIPKHQSLDLIKNGLVAWVRANSPIQWNSKEEVSMRDGWKPEDFKVEEASDVPFNQRPAYLNAQKAANDAGKNALKPITESDLIARIKGLRKFIISATEKNKDGEVRGIGKVAGKVSRVERDKMLALVAKVESVALPADDSREAA